MTKIRKTYSKAVKFKAALDMIKSEKTVEEISREYSVHQSVLHKWKKALLEQGADIFEDQRKKASDEVEISDLERKIGKLVMENDFLKKVLGQ